jgi:hypothetical protein
MKVISLHVQLQLVVKQILHFCLSQACVVSASCQLLKMDLLDVNMASRVAQLFDLQKASDHALLLDS